MVITICVLLWFIIKECFALGGKGVTRLSNTFFGLELCLGQILHMLVPSWDKLFYTLWIGLEAIACRILYVGMYLDILYCTYVLSISCKFKPFLDQNLLHNAGLTVAVKQNVSHEVAWWHLNVHFCTVPSVWSSLKCLHHEV